MSLSFSPMFTCDACAKTTPGASTSAYSPPPVGWLWAGHTQEGPHACSERCWWHVSNAVRARTGQSLEAISHDSVEVVEDDAPPSALAVRAQPTAVLVPEVVEEDEEEEPPARPVRTAKPAAKQAKPASKIVPLGASGACVQCGGEMPPRGPGRFPRTKCFDCQPKRERAS